MAKPETTLYRRHRGGLDESMATACPVTDFDHLVALIRSDREGWPDQGDVTPETVAVEPYGHDSRIGWDTHVVTVRGRAVGFTSGPLT